MLLVLFFLLPAITFSTISAGEMGMRQCAACICEASTGWASSLTNKKYNTRCVDEFCGPCHIGRQYWVDGGRQTILGQKAIDPLAYDNCVQDVFCAAKTVHERMRNVTIDCNQDGKIDCDDYVLVHGYGGENCRQDLNDVAIVGDWGKRYLHCKFLVNGLGPEEEEDAKCLLSIDNN